MCNIQSPRYETQSVIARTLKNGCPEWGIIKMLDIQYSKGDNNRSSCCRRIVEYMYLETGCPKLAIVKFLGFLVFKGDHNILRLQP